MLLGWKILCSRNLTLQLLHKIDFQYHYVSYQRQQKLQKYNRRANKSDVWFFSLFGNTTLVVYHHFIVYQLLYKEQKSMLCWYLNIVKRSLKNFKLRFRIRWVHKKQKTLDKKKKNIWRKWKTSTIRNFIYICICNYNFTFISHFVHYILQSAFCTLYSHLLSFALRYLYVCFTTFALYLSVVYIVEVYGSYIFLVKRFDWEVQVLPLKKKKQTRWLGNWPNYIISRYDLP